MEKNKSSRHHYNKRFIKKKENQNFDFFKRLFLLRKTLMQRKSFFFKCKAFSIILHIHDFYGYRSFTSKIPSIISKKNIFSSKTRNFVLFKKRSSIKNSVSK